VISRFQHWRTLRKLGSERRSAEQGVHEASARAKKEGKSSKEIYEIEHVEIGSVFYAEDRISEEISKYLIAQANKYNLPTPSYNDKDLWEESYGTGRRHLHRSAIADLRAQIRNEQNERWRYWELRLKVIGVLLTAATGAFGAAIGLIAIWGGTLGP